MPNKRPRTPPFSLRFTFEERAQLERDAADMALGAYIRSRVFDESCPPRRSRRRRPVKDHKELARLLGMLGDSRLATNINQLSRAVNSGSLILTPARQAKLDRACDDIHFMRIVLMRALGYLRDDDDDDEPFEIAGPAPP